MPLIVHTAIAGFDDPDVLVISRSQNDRIVADGVPGGHRGVGVFFSPSAGLQKRRMRQCGFSLATESDPQWVAFCESYTAEMRISYKRNRKAWLTVLGWDRVVITSREAEPPRAVRTILAQWILPRLGARYAGELG